MNTLDDTPIKMYPPLSYTNNKLKTILFQAVLGIFRFEAETWLALPT